ncbi:hypothetical protein J0L31_17625 [Terrisporobacter glycolicus]|nr:hypothetical protein [Terrisporobacter glycolicus]
MDIKEGNKKVFEIYINLIKDFRDEALNGELNNLKEFNFETLKLLTKRNEKKKYVNISNFDSDNTEIARAITYVVMQDVIEDNIEKIDTKMLDDKYRLDTMNSFNTILTRNLRDNIGFKCKDNIGSNCKNVELQNLLKVESEFKNEYDKLDKYIEIKEKIIAFYKKYHTIGNFMLLPQIRENNKDRRTLGFYKNNSCEDSLVNFLNEIGSENKSQRLEELIEKNKYYFDKDCFKKDDKLSFNFKKFIEINFLEGYEKIPSYSRYDIEDRLEYKDKLEKYIDESIRFIDNRTDIIIEVLDKVLYK